jgi:hypothetical protein
VYSRGRILISKWTGIALAILLLSQSIAHWRAFFASPTALTYVALIGVLTLFLLLFLGLGVVIYAEEKNRSNIEHPRPFFERWADRFFLIHSTSVDSRGSK